MSIKVSHIIPFLKHKGFEVFTSPYELNIVGIRSPETISNKFDDEIHVFFKNDSGKWLHFSYPATTDPGTYYLKNPIQVEGTAILKEGQYKDVYRLGLHRGEYEALVQHGGKVTVIRDYDRNAILDFRNGEETSGWYGINIHHALAYGSTETVGKWSAGCQVFKNINDFQKFMQLCKLHQKYHGNHFTYTLIDLRAMRRDIKRWLTYGLASMGLLSLVTLITYYFINKTSNT